MKKKSEKAYVFMDEMEDIELEEGFYSWYCLSKIYEIPMDYFNEENWTFWGRNVDTNIDYFVANCL